MVLKDDQNSCGPNRRWWRRLKLSSLTSANIAKVAVDVLALLLAGNWMLVTLLIYTLALTGAIRGLQQLGDLGLENGDLLPLPLIIWAAVWMVLGFVPLMAAVTWMLRWVERKLWGERPRRVSSKIHFTPAVDRWLRASARGAVRFQVWLGWVGITCFMLSFGPVAVDFVSHIVFENAGLDIRYGIAAYAGWVVVTAWALFMWCLWLQKAATDRIPH